MLPYQMNQFRFIALSVFCVFGYLLTGGEIFAEKPVQEWTLEEVLEAIATANGGMDIIEATTNIRIMGKVNSGSSSYDFLLLKKRPNKMRIKMMFKGRSVETGFNGLVGWRRISQDGIAREIVELTPEELEEANLDVDFDGPLIGEPVEGTELRLIGVERSGRVDYFVIGVLRGGIENRHYIDSRTFKEWKTVRETTDSAGEPLEIVSEYFDYQRLGTFWLAYRLEKRYSDGRRETIEIKTAEMDPGLIDQVFNLPRDWLGETALDRE